MSCLKVCQNHRDNYGIYWKRTSNKCKHPLHGSSKSKADRGITFSRAIEIQVLWKELVIVGDGICRECRDKHGKQMENGTKRIINEHSPDEETNTSKDTIIQSVTDVDMGHGSKEYEEYEEKVIPRKKCRTEPSEKILGPGFELTNSQIFGSDYTVTDESQTSSQGSDWLVMQMSPKDRFNQAMKLLATDNQPLRSQVTMDWRCLQKSSRSYYVAKASEAVHCILSFIAPGQEEIMLPDLIKYIQPQPVENDFLIDTIIKAYQSCDHSTTQIQILSIIVNKYTKEQLRSMIPNLSVSKIDCARRHAALEGPGQKINHKPIFRDRLTRPKITHFLEFISCPAFCQIVGFGSKLIKMSNGVEVRIPKVVRTVISTRIVELYTNFCNTSDFNQLSRASLFRILKVCSASQKTSLRGLDNTIADGMKAIEMLEKIVKKCSTFGLSADQVKYISSQVQRVNVHLKFEVKGHISRNSNVAMHCSTYALSDKASKSFKGECQHEHIDDCEMCTQVSTIVKDVKEAYMSVNEQIPDELKEEIEHEISIANQFLNDWHSHLIRTVHQESAKQNVLRNLRPTETLIIMDWAMKFIPFLHREKQTDFFGKKGISWHLSCAVTKEQESDQLNLECFIHILEDGIQDWYAVACILNHTLQEMKMKRPQLTCAFLKSDNAGCYHNANLLAFIQSRNQKLISDESIGITVSQYNFSEPQAGKDLCDSKTSHSKLPMLRYADEGNDILTAIDMKTALDSHGGLRGTFTSVVAVGYKQETMACKKRKVKIAGISYLNNFIFQEEGIIARKAYEIGSGQTVNNQDLQLHQFSVLEHFEVIKPFDNVARTIGLVHIKPSKEVETTPDVENNNEHDEIATDMQQSETHVPVQVNVGYPCVEPGCIKEFVTEKGLENHILQSTHIYSKQPALDNVRQMWVEKCEDLQSAIPTYNLETRPGNSKTVIEGWCLKKAKKAVRFSYELKEFLFKIYMDCDITGKRPSYEDISDLLKKERYEDGSRKFKPNDWLTSGQIRSLFGSFTVKKTKIQKSGVQLTEVDLDASEDPELSNILENMESNAREDTIQTLSTEILDVM